MGHPHVQRDDLDRYLARVLAHQPEPPRTVSLRELLHVLLLRKEVAYFAAFTIGALAFALYLITKRSIPNGSTSMSERYLGFLILVVAFLPVAALSIESRRTFKALRYGILIEAEVLQVTFYRPSYTSTIAAWDIGGHATGRLRVQMNSESFEQDFRFDRPWIKRLAPGRHVNVLIDPNKKNKKRFLLSLDVAD